MKKELIKCLIMLAAGGQWAFAGGFGVASAAPSDAKKVYFLAPTEDDRWMTSVPMISLDGGKTKLPMTVDSERCGWFYYTFSSEHPVTDNVVFMLNGAKSLADAIGVNGTAEEGETAVPILCRLIMKHSLRRMKSSSFRRGICGRLKAMVVFMVLTLRWMDFASLT